MMCRVGSGEFVVSICYLCNIYNLRNAMSSNVVQCKGIDMFVDPIVVFWISSPQE